MVCLDLMDSLFNEFKTVSGSGKLQRSLSPPPCGRTFGVADDLIMVSTCVQVYKLINVHACPMTFIEFFEMFRILVEYQLVPRITSGS